MGLSSWASMPFCLRWGLGWDLGLYDNSTALGLGSTWPFLFLLQLAFSSYFLCLLGGASCTGVGP